MDTVTSDLATGGEPPLVIHRRGCHCRAVAFEMAAPEHIDALDCNCSICSKTGFLHLIVPRARFHLLRGEDMR